MRGQIMDYDLKKGEGLISGEDGKRYTFDMSEWEQQTMPARGQRVDFDAGEGVALKVYTLTSASGDKSKIVAALLAFFLGMLGAHKFYLGYKGAGLIMLLGTLFGWVLLFIPWIIIGIIAFIEFIIYLVTDDAEFEQRYVVNQRPWF